jgi:hypothetical protein
MRGNVTKIVLFRRLSTVNDDERRNVPFGVAMLIRVTDTNWFACN